MDVQALIQDTVLDDAVALLGSHRARLYDHQRSVQDRVDASVTYTKRVPGSFNVTLNPLLNMGNIFLGVLEILVHVLGVAIEEAGIGCLAGFNWH